MNNHNVFKEKIKKAYKNIIDTQRECLHPNCSLKAINSHVLQSSSILQGVCDSTNHFISIGHPKFYLKENELPLNIKPCGLQNSYKFPGFCHTHDDQIFAPIEKGPIDFSNWFHIALLSYRTLCLEIRQKEMDMELIKANDRLQKECFPEGYYLPFVEGYGMSMKELQFFKTELEADLDSQIPNNFDYEFRELPIRKICFSSPQNNDDPSDIKSQPMIDLYGNEVGYLATCVLNFFPYNGKSYLTLANHKKYDSKWGKDLLNKIQNPEQYDKILSDILTYRILFWAMSPEIFKQISKEKFEEYKKEAIENLNNFRTDYETNFNLFSI